MNDCSGVSIMDMTPKRQQDIKRTQKYICNNTGEYQVALFPMVYNMAGYKGKPYGRYGLK